MGGFAFMYVCAQVCASWLQRPMRVIKPLEMFWTAMCVLGIEPGSLILEPSYQPPRVCFLEVNPCISVRVKFCLCSKDIEMHNTPYVSKSHCLVQPPLSSRGLGTSHAVQSVCVLCSEPRMQGCCVIQHQSPLSEASHFEHTFNVTWCLFLYIEKLYTVARVFDTLTSSYATPCGVMNHSSTGRGDKTAVRPDPWKLSVSWERPVGLGTPVPTLYTMTLKTVLHQHPRASLDSHAETSRNLLRDL